MPETVPVCAVALSLNLKTMSFVLLTLNVPSAGVPSAAFAVFNLLARLAIVKAPASPAAIVATIVWPSAVTVNLSPEATVDGT